MTIVTVNQHAGLFSTLISKLFYTKEHFKTLVQPTIKQQILHAPIPQLIVLLSLIAVISLFGYREIVLRKEVSFSTYIGLTFKTAFLNYLFNDMGRGAMLDGYMEALSYLYLIIGYLIFLMMGTWRLFLFLRDQFRYFNLGGVLLYFFL